MASAAPGADQMFWPGHSDRVSRNQHVISPLDPAAESRWAEWAEWAAEEKVLAMPFMSEERSGKLVVKA